MKISKFNRDKVGTLMSFVLILSILSALILPEFVKAAGAPPDITVKLGDTIVDYDHDIVVEDEDKLEIIADFRAMNAGDTYEVELPGIFLNLNEEIIRESNKDILKFVELTILKDPVTGKQRIKIEFLENIDAASFSFWAILNIEDDDYDKEQEIIVDGDMIIVIVPEEPHPPQGEYTGPYAPPPKVPEYDKDLKKGVSNEISEKEFLEDADINNAMYYNIGVNMAQFDKVLSGTLKDTLPTGMKLFVPSASGCGKDSYEFAFASMTIFLTSTVIKGADDDNCYINISDIYGAAAKYIGYVNAVEISQGRSGNYSIADLMPSIKIPSYIAESIKNSDRKYVTYDSIDIGYKIDESGKIHTIAIDNAHSDIFEREHSGPWTNDALYIPMYNTADCKTSIYREYAVVNQTVLQNMGDFSDSARREYLGSTVNGSETSYRWSYKYNSIEELVLVVKNDSVGDIDTFEIEMKGNENSYSFGKALQVFPRVYFDKTKWNIPSTGEIVFKNKITYENWEREAGTKYIYDFGSSGTVVLGAEKTVDGDKTNHQNPDADSTIQKYELTFKKFGDEKIPSGNFEVFDQLDAGLMFVNNSISIYRESKSGEWINITDQSLNTDTSATSTAVDGVNLKAYYDSAAHKIVIVNVGEMTFTGRIKIEFSAEIAPDVEYGTKIINYFGDLTETFVNHKIAVNKIDSEGAPITAASASFEIQYTTNEDFENGTLHDLTDTFGNPLNTLTTNTDGTASALYIIDDEVFYLKIRELTPPDGYIGLDTPIWIKAERDSVSQRMNYSLVNEIEGVTMSINENSMVTFNVENEKPRIVTPEPTEVSLEASKVAHGMELVDGQFEFAVFEGENIVAIGSNTADGKIIFTPISYNAIGNHSYKIKETSEKTDNWTMDEREFTVDVEVTADNEGKLTAKVIYEGGDITFVNKYTVTSEPTGSKPITSDITTTSETNTTSETSSKSNTTSKPNTTAETSSKLNTTSKSGTASATTSKSSETKNSTSKFDENKLPNTGDECNMLLFASIMILSLAAIYLCAKSRKIS